MENPKSPFESYDVEMDAETMVLLKIAENPELAPVKPGENVTEVEQDVYRFIRSLGIVKGTKKVPIYIIYDAYAKWTSLKQVKQLTFSKNFKKVFPMKRTGAHRFCELDPAPFHLPDNYSMWTDPVILGKK